jgi:hypothetical protein
MTKNKGCHVERSEVSSTSVLATQRQRADFAKEAQDDKNKGCHDEPREANVVPYPSLRAFFAKQSVCSVVMLSVAKSLCVETFNR